MTKKRSSGETLISTNADGDGAGGHEIRVNDTPLDEQPALNFKDNPSGGISFAGTDDSGDEETEIKAALAIASLTNKAVPHPDDIIPIADSEDGDSPKGITIEDLTIVAAGGTTKTRRTATVIYEHVLASNGAFDTGTLPTGYDSFEIEAALRSTVSAAADSAYLYYNSDFTAANYRQDFSGSSNGSASNGALDNPGFTTCPGATGTSGYFGHVRVHIFEPEDTSHFKISNTLNADRRTATDHVVYNTAHHWESSSAITSIQIRTDNHATDLFLAGSWIRVIGYKEEGIGGGITQFTELLDAPGDYASHAGEYPRVKLDESGLEFASGVAGGKLRRVGTVLHDEVLGSAGTFDVTGISQDYDDLEIIYEGRCVATSSGGVQNVNTSLNNDTTDANYRLQTIGGSTSTASAGASTQRLSGAVVGSDATAGRTGTNRFWIYDYTSARLKKMAGWLWINNTTQFVIQRAYEWQNTAAVNRISISVAHATTTFEAGSRLRIIGWRYEMIGGLETSDAAISSTPTDAELDGIFGTPATVGDGFQAIVDDGGAGTDVWLVVAKNGKWWGTQLTELT